MISASSTRSAIDGVEFQATCFACGSDNPHGLRLKFHVGPEGTAAASLVLGPEWEGPRGIVHGGIVSTLLDEAMAKAVAATGCKTMTAELRVRFRQYAETGSGSRSEAGLSGVRRGSWRPKPCSLPKTAASALMLGRNS